MGEKENNNCSVYVHIFPNSKLYFGITSLVPQIRWGNNGIGYQGQCVYSAINKYGWDNIEHIILYDNLTLEQANNYEKLFIKYYDTKIDNGNGYNVTNGGNGTCGYIWSEEQKLILSKSHMGLNNFINKTENEMEEINKKRSKSITETINSEDWKAKNKGIHIGHIVSKETKDKISNSLIGYKRSDSFKKKLSDIHNIPVICVSTGEIFKSTKEASKFYNCDSSNITACCKGRLKTAGKFNGVKLVWEYCTNM